MLLVAVAPGRALAQSCPTTPQTMLSWMQNHAQTHPVGQQEWSGCQQQDGVACFRFTWSVVETINQNCDTQCWGLLSKQAGEWQCTPTQCGNLGGQGYGEDAIVWQAAPGPETVYDIIQNAGGPNPQLQMLQVDRRPNNRWVCPWEGQNQPPVLTAVTPSPHTAYVGWPYARQLQLTQGTPPITWTVLQGPPGLQVGGNGLVSGWTPASAQGGILHTIQVRASNAHGSDTATWQVLVTWPGDHDLDFDVDQEDFGAFQACLSGAAVPHAPGCEWADIDGDGDVDADDFTHFHSCMNGADKPPNC